jgi:hypothetical protein
MIFRIAFAVLIWFIVAASPAQNSTPRLSLTISTPNATISSGAEVRLHFMIKNISDQVVYVRKPFGDENHGDMSYDIVIVDAKGLPAPDTALGRLFQGSHGPAPPSGVLWQRFSDESSARKERRRRGHHSSASRPNSARNLHHPSFTRIP